MAIFEGPFLFFWVFAGMIVMAYHSYFFFLSVVKVDRKPKEAPEDLPENILRFPDKSFALGLESDEKDFAESIKNDTQERSFDRGASTVMSTEEVKAHFTARAGKYDASSHWCTDPALAECVLGLLQPRESMNVLDVACGTGLVSQWFKGRVGHVLGVDITPAMFEQARDRLNEFRVGSGEALPVDDGLYDIVVCRQGTQFMDDAVAIQEMTRACKSGGHVCIINLCAYGNEDKNEYFEVLRQRNPVRRNFYLREDLSRLMRNAGLVDVVVHDHISNEDVDAWSDNGAIPESRREAIRNIYRNGSAEFMRLHAVAQETDGRFIDAMLFGIAIGRKA